MSKPLNAQSVAQKWSQNLGAATTSYTQGVQGVSVSPGQSALAAGDKYIAGVQQSYANGTYAKGLQSFTLQDWQSAAVTKGAPRLASGASAAKSKMQSFFSSFIPALQNVQNQVQSMPSTSYEERKARANAMMDGLHAMKGNFKQ